jgi:hypothetical protein
MGNYPKYQKRKFTDDEIEEIAIQLKRIADILEARLGAV